MKHVALMLVLASLISVATYNDTLSGSQTAAPEAEGIALNLTAAGDLPGMTKVNLHRNGENVTSGTLRLTVLPQNADATSSERGQLVGTISGDTGCNTFHGEYTLDGRKLHIGPLATTRKACPSSEASKQEAGYIAALESAVRIEQAGPQLTLFNAKGQMAVTLTRR